MKTVFIWILSWLTVSTVLIPIAAASEGMTAELEQKMAEIQLLNEQLTAQKVQAILLREQLYEKKETFRQEILEEKKRLKIKTATEAEKKSPRIKYNMRLIRELLAYIDGFNDRIRYYQIGNDKLSYLLRQCEDELKIVQTLNETKIEALTSQVELVLAQYLSDAHTIVLSPEDFTFQRPEVIWKKEIQGRR